MALFDSNRTDAELAELQDQLSDLAAEVRTLWRLLGAATAGSGVDEVAVRNSTGYSASDRIARDLGYRLGRGQSAGVIVRSVLERLKNAAERRVERALAGALGGGIAGSFAGGLGAALIEEGVNAIIRALRSRRLHLPLVEDKPAGGFPLAADYREIVPAGTEREDNIEQELARKLAQYAMED
jgi:hypothetical protein